MPELKSVAEVTKSFTSQYDKWCSEIKKNPETTHGTWFNTDSGSICIKKVFRASGDLVVCVERIDLNGEYQNKGILSSFIRYIQKNPYIFKEIEIENIATEELLNSFIKKGFNSTMDVKKIEEMALTLVKKLK
jgi:hypothetical protein